MKRVRVSYAPEYGVGTTDAVNTYCCEALPSWYVVFAGERPWEGHYFHVTDLVIQ